MGTKGSQRVGKGLSLLDSGATEEVEKEVYKDMKL
jgi:hypothetical protein